jgi:hypothetical protein
MIGLINTFLYEYNLSSLQLITITLNQFSAEPFFLDCRGLAPFLFSFCDWLLIYNWTTYIVSARTNGKHTRCPAMDICESHRKHLFPYCFYSALHSNGNYPIVARVFVVAGMCLPCRCPATALHITIWYLLLFLLSVLPNVRQLYSLVQVYFWVS